MNFANILLFSIWNLTLSLNTLVLISSFRPTRYNRKSFCAVICNKIINIRHRIVKLFPFILLKNHQFSCS